MRFHLERLELSFRKANEEIKFEDFNWFFGQMGAGKSTIARLIDYCLGGDLGESEMTPALQSEFNAASLTLSVENKEVILRRQRKSNQIRASFELNQELYEVIVPARVADGEVIPDSGIEVVSDLLFVLSGRKPPRVRKGKIKKDSELTRLSFRDLWWYCYLDQDSMDSSFFNLDRNANNFKRLKSRDVLRFIIGFYQEQVSELEVELELCRQERMEKQSGASAMKSALEGTDIETRRELENIQTALTVDIKATETSNSNIRNDLEHLRSSHLIEELKAEARLLSEQISDLELALSEINTMISSDKEHKNELLSLSTKYRRSQSAREVLEGVHFEDCPSCSSSLPIRAENACSLCGQDHSLGAHAELRDATAEQDIDDRVKELDYLISRHKNAITEVEKSIRQHKQIKRRIDEKISKESEKYDSAYLSFALEKEKEIAAKRQQLIDLHRIEALFDKVDSLQESVSKLLMQESELENQLKDARSKAEQDTKNLDRLKKLFLDCLVRSEITGFYYDDEVEMNPPHYLPEITSSGVGSLAVTSFANLGSGGKKTLFKCCFALAIHRLAVELNALIPSVLIIDSPMKNISERENREQFEGFHNLVYELANTELHDTQIIMIDKEISAPPQDFDRTFFSRHMQPNNRDKAPDQNIYPPLIHYYKDK